MESKREREVRKPSTSFKISDYLVADKRPTQRNPPSAQSVPESEFRSHGLLPTPQQKASSGGPSEPVAKSAWQGQTTAPSQSWERAASRIVLGETSAVLQSAKASEFQEEKQKNPAFQLPAPFFSVPDPSQVAQFDTDSDDSENGDSISNRAGVEALEESIFSRYFQNSLRDTGEPEFQTGVQKIREQLVAVQSGAATCLICLERIKAADPIWDCKIACNCIVHLVCIQSWARQAVKNSSNQNSATWHCPKCRTEYPEREIPREYRCFCGKTADPEFDPWLSPHSCGEACERKLPGNCGHRCTLLCHPGPCPPCPQSRSASCHCGRTSKVVRCGAKGFSCRSVCDRQLACGAHRCPNSCHPGECPPCSVFGTFECECGKSAQEITCGNRPFLCEEVCGKLLPCGKHSCQAVCHPGKCTACPLAGKRSCPCGKKWVTEAATCGGPGLPPCGATCERPLSCGRHSCQQRCHTGPCEDTCRIVVRKTCRCGATAKEVPCSSSFQCERRCSNMRSCLRHACKRRCCGTAGADSCPPCPEICSKKLRCSNHKCPAPCHSGPCPPCPLTVRIPCACGETAFNVPCGAEKHQKPPKCTRDCQVAPVCHHPEAQLNLRKPHRCHYGPCPPCNLTCAKPFRCGHQCSLRCHGPRPAPLPPFTLNPTKKQRQSFARLAMEGASLDSAAPCPPCGTPVVRECLGQHVEKTVPCCARPLFPCDSLCGNLLACGLHRCTCTCHSVSLRRAVTGGDTVLEERVGSGSHDSCEPCPLQCQRPRSPPCPHPCPLPCHLSPCAACHALVKKPCHCGSLVHAMDCCDWTKVSSSPAERETALRCGGPCHRKLPHCTHLCPLPCHSGPCPEPTLCRKKVVVRCSCLRLKKEWLCKDVQLAEGDRPALPGRARAPAGVGLLECDAVCTREKEKLAMAEREERRRRDEEERKELEGLKVSAPAGLRRRRRRTQTEAETDGKSFVSKALESWYVRGSALLLAAVLVALVLYFGLVHLNEYLNEREAEYRRGMRRERHLS